MGATMIWKPAFISYRVHEWTFFSPAEVFERVDVPFWHTISDHLAQDIELCEIEEWPHITACMSRHTQCPAEVRQALHRDIGMTSVRHILAQEHRSPTPEAWFRWADTLQGRRLLLTEVVAAYRQLCPQYPLPERMSAVLQALYLCGLFDWLSPIGIHACKRCGYAQGREHRSKVFKVIDVLRGKEEQVVQMPCASCGQGDCRYCPRCAKLGLAKSCQPYLHWYGWNLTQEASTHHEPLQQQPMSLRTGTNAYTSSHDVTNMPSVLQWEGQLSAAQQQASDQLQSFVQQKFGLRLHKAQVYQEQGVQTQTKAQFHANAHDLDQVQTYEEDGPHTCQEVPNMPARHSGPHEFLIWAICGAGKTEILFHSLDDVLKCGKKVLITSPRRDVVTELAPRLKDAFPRQTVRVLHGESEEKYEAGDLFLATTHQTLRFHGYFDLIVIDEEDAFPYHFDNMLQYAVQRALRPSGVMVYLTATPNRHMQKRVRRQELPYVTITRRFHGHPLAVPQLKPVGSWRKTISSTVILTELLAYVQHLIQEERYGYLFVPRVDDLQPVMSYIEDMILPYITRQGPPLGHGFAMDTVHSEDERRTEVVQRFRRHDIRLLITTTILERGVTIPYCDVAVLGSDDPVFNEAALIQMAGRAGRKPDDPIGNVWFFPEVRTQDQVSAINRIKGWNKT
ncbi:helicase-related protein [Caldalkalibacillus salinus]|uniref:helicase-related protein n=1 Tax=Caldalkalibacillus salinus TaxID=2803787 RepID=UPI0019247C6F|nr:helicase-related protein [Caldalkalibacillus salinus]